MSQDQMDVPSARPVTVGSVNWHSVLDFTQLFRGFRLAISPSKIVLALLAILLIYTAGRVFDLAWGPQVYSGEIDSFQREKPEVYQRMRADRLRSIEPDLKQMLMFAHDKDDGFTDDQINELPKHPRAAYRALKTLYERQFQNELKDIRSRRMDQEKARDGSHSSDDLKSPAQVEQDDRAIAAKRLQNSILRAKEARGGEIFDSFMGYELSQFDALVDNTLSIVRIGPVRSNRSADVDSSGQAVSLALASENPDRFWRSDTMLGCAANMAITGPLWIYSASAPMQWRPENADTWGGWVKMIGYRALYLGSLVLFTLFSLLVAAVTGATLARMSAMELAGVERAPVKDAVMFSLRRLWVFVKTPITPFLILLVVGILLAVIGLVGAVPFIGEVVLGVFFIVFLVVGFVLMLLLLGVLGGFNLLYPAVAVEGADAFDAMSRSFAYVYARPWRLLFYTVAALIYGVITYLFVSFAAYVMLLVTHIFVGWGTNLLGVVNGSHSGVSKLETLWPTPQFMRLMPLTNWYAMSWSEYVGSMFLHFWVYLLISAVGAYVISYYFSSNTIIYLLLRRSVDGQATTEVFSEESAEPVDAVVLAPEVGAGGEAAAEAAPPV